MATTSTPQKRDIKGGLFLLVVAGLLLYLGIQESSLWISGQSVHATIIGHERNTGTRRSNSGDMHNSYKVKYAFMHAGKRYVSTYTRTAYDIMDIARGKSVEVRFMPNNPATNSAVEQLNPLYVLLKLVGGLALAVYSVTRLRNTV